MSEQEKHCNFTRRAFMASAIAAPVALAGNISLTHANDDTAHAGRARADDTIHTGGAKNIALKEGYNAWAKPVAIQPGTLPVLTLHGGPGLPHFYFECFEDYLPQAGIGYWYYDQLGSGFADQPKDKALWNLERFVAEVEQVRASLGLEKFVLFGHSWGGLLAIEYALNYPQRLSGLVISNMTASIQSYLKRIAALRAQLPAKTAHRLAELERARAYDSQEYESIVFDTLYREHICRLDPMPEPVTRAVRWMSAPVYNTMQGRSEFEVTGTLKGWDRWNDLHKIAAPALILGGQFDTMDPEDLRRMSRVMPNATTVICENGSHLSMYDDQEAYFAALVPFLKKTTRIT